jgi:hypothetical protein
VLPVVVHIAAGRLRRLQLVAEGEIAIGVELQVCAVLRAPFERRHRQRFKTSKLSTASKLRHDYGFKPFGALAEGDQIGFHMCSLPDADQGDGTVASVRYASHTAMADIDALPRSLGCTQSTHERATRTRRNTRKTGRSG